MAELTFCRQFLTTLDSRPARLSSDYINDPRKHPAQSAYILPKLPNPKRKRGADATEGTHGPFHDGPTTIAVTLTLTPPRTEPGPLTVDVEPTASVHDLKERFATYVGLDPAAGVAKVKVLKDKRPVSDVKSVGELADGGRTLALGVMVMGGISAKPAVAAGEDSKMDVDERPAPVAGGTFGAAAMAEEGFWGDLRGFLEQRVKDQATAEKAVQIWRKAWADQGDK